MSGHNYNYGTSRVILIHIFCDILLQIPIGY